MKKIIKYTAIIIAFLTATFFAQAQSSVTIGAANNNGGAYPLYSPVYRFSATSATTHVRSNILFTQAELTAAGLPQGAIINSVEFNKVLSPNFIIPADFKMYMANSNSTALSNTMMWSSILNTHSLVFTNNSFNLPPAEGWVKWDVTPFVYTGGALEIATELIMSGSGATNGYWSWQFDASVPTNLIIGNTGTGTPPAVLSGTNANYLRRPNIRISYTTSPLSVKLVQFTATKKDKQVLLQWTVDKEEHVQAYEVQQSFDGINFSAVATQLPTSATIATKSYGVLVPYTAIRTYYRLKMIDKDGSFTYSPLVEITAASNAFSLQFFPLPFKEQLYCRLHTTKAGKIQLRIYNMQGKLIRQWEQSLHSGQTLIPLYGIEEWTKGMYIAEVIMGENSYTQLLIK